MKKFLAIAVFGAIITACSKKEPTYVQDSNTMLEEPAAPAVVTDTAKKATDKTVVATPAATPVDTTAVKK